jgi:hypothetical protein
MSEVPLGQLVITNISYQDAQKICDHEYGSIMWLNGKAYPSGEIECIYKNNTELFESITIPIAEYEAMKNGLEDYKRNYIKACKGRKDFRNAFREARSEIFRLQESLDKAKEI